MPICRLRRAQGFGGLLSGRHSPRGGRHLGEGGEEVLSRRAGSAQEFQALGDERLAPAPHGRLGVNLGQAVSRRRPDRGRAADNHLADGAGRFAVVGEAYDRELMGQAALFDHAHVEAGRSGRQMVRLGLHPDGSVSLTLNVHARLP
jgi:hypothetical protein